MSKTYGTNLILRSQRYMRDPTRGKRAVAIWDGTPEQIFILSATFGQGISWETDDSNAPKWSLTAQTPDDTDLLTVWEVHGIDMHKSIYEAPTTKNTTLVPDADLTNIRQYMKGPETATPPTLTTANANLCLYLLRHQQDSFFVPRYVLRERIIGSVEGFPAPVNFPSMAGKVFTTAQICSGGAYDMIIAPLIQTFINDIPTESDTTGNSNWGWLMKTPTISSLPAGKYEYRQEFWLDLWSKYFYTTPP